MSVRLRDRVEAEAQRLLGERAARLRHGLEEALRVLNEPMHFPLSPGDWGAAEGSGLLQSVRDAVEALGRGETQREILASLLDAAAAFYPRAAIFVLKGGGFSGWAGLGFLGEGGLGSDDLPRVAISGAGDHLLVLAVKQRMLARAGKEGPGAEIVRALGGIVPSEASATPLLLRGRPVAVLYGDTGSNGTSSGHGLPLEIVARIAGIAMERIAPGAAVSKPAQAGAHQEARGASTAPLGPARPGGAAPPEEAEMQALLGDLTRQPRRDSADGGLSEDDRRRHADARRFANLLVSELLLYNEAAVIQGRKHGDLKQRLKKEIEHSRQAYDARAAGLSSAGKDYFDEELVRQLALGDTGLVKS